MSKEEKFWVLAGPCMMSFIYAWTYPIIHVYFVSLISAKVLAVANMLSLGLGAIVNLTVPLTGAKELYRSHFPLIVGVDVICFCIVSYGGLSNPEIRFLGFAILNAVSTTLWTVVMRNSINRVTDGDVLTDFESQQKSGHLIAALAGGILTLCTEMDVTNCIILQCAANLMLGLADLKAWAMLTKKDCERRQ